MPAIREYTSQTQVAGPVGGRRASAADFGGGALAGTGRGLAQFAQALQQREERAEISDLNAKMAETQAQWSVQLQETLRTADPGDDTVSERFLTQFDEYTAQIGGAIETRAGQEYFDRQSAQLRAHFTEAAFKGQAVLAGVKAKQDYAVALNSYSSALVSDPSTFEMNLALHNEGLDNLVALGGLSQAAAEELKTSGAQALAKSAVRGWVDLDAPFAKEQLEDGRWDMFLGGDLKVQMLGEVDQAIRAEEVEAARQRKAQEQAFKEAQAVTQNEFLAKMVAGDLTTNDILNSNLDPFGSGSKEQFIGMLDAANKAGSGGIKTNPAVFREAFRRIHLPDGDPEKLVDENDLNELFVNGGISMEDLGKLRGEMQGRQTQAGAIESDLKKTFLDAAESAITGSNPLMGIRDPRGDEIYHKFNVWFLEEFEKQRAAGKSVNALLDPDSPDYLGKAISRFARTPQQYFRDLMSFNPGLDIDGPEGGPDAPLAGPGGDIPGLVAPGNIDLAQRPIVRNSDGTISTVRSMSINVDGQEVLIPTVSDDGRIMPDEEAIQTFQQTGRHLGKFSSVEAAEAYAQRLHEEQARFYDIPSRATQTATSADGEKVYFVDGEWVRADGTKVQ